MLAIGGKEVQSKLSASIESKNIFNSLLQSGRGAQVAFRCLPYLNSWKKMTENLRRFDDLKEVPSQYFSFLGQVITEFSHKDSVKLLVEDMIQDCYLKKLAFDPRACWILATVLRSKEPTHLRIVARWSIRRLGSLVVHNVGINLAIAVLERLIGNSSVYQGAHSPLIHLLLKDLNEPEFSVIRSHLLGLMVTKLTDLNRDEVESILDFDKLLVEAGDTGDQEPPIIKAAKDSVAHR